ncbi:MAG: protein gvpF/L [Arthrospira sp. PLM2.Bin9]|nr:GvpL/GvpF family gas vesicle protein [Arthrospira sp. PLM2.Bin9]TVU54437.1 MAG: protein gvpF/L [Arthrospira sp. PLM2.Bin9]
MSYGLYLYGILPKTRLKSGHLQGLDKQPVYTHEIDEFIFLYSEAQQERYLASRRHLLGHEKVLEAMMQEGYRTILPLQFGLIVSDWDAVAKQLVNPYHDKLKELFVKLAGNREVGVKVFWDETAELNALMEENQDLRKRRDRLEGKPLSMDEVIAIGREIEGEILGRKDEIITAFQDGLIPLALDYVENESMTDLMIYNAAYLIPWDSEEKFGKKVEEIDSYFPKRLKIRYNNLTAPYNFTQLD